MFRPLVIVSFVCFYARRCCCCSCACVCVCVQEPLTSEERQAGKKINFAVLYGAGARQLAKDLGKSQKEAKQFLDK